MGKIVKMGVDKNCWRFTLAAQNAASVGQPAKKILDGAVLHGDHVVVDADKKAGKMTFKVSERVGEKAVARAKK